MARRKQLNTFYHPTGEKPWNYFLLTHRITNIWRETFTATAQNDKSVNWFENHADLFTHAANSRQPGNRVEYLERKHLSLMTNELCVFCVRIKRIIFRVAPGQGPLYHAHINIIVNIRSKKTRALSLTWQKRACSARGMRKKSTTTPQTNKHCTKSSVIILIYANVRLRGRVRFLFSYASRIRSFISLTLFIYN